MKELKMKTMKIIFFILLFILIVEVGLTFGVRIYTRTKIKNEILSLNDTELTAKLIKTRYIFDTPYTEEELKKYPPEEQFKLIGDDYAQYLTQEGYEKRMDIEDLKFIGLGFHSLEIGEGYVEIVEILKNSPVEEAGLIKGDRIIKINGKSIKDMALPEIINLIEEDNEKDTVLTIKRDNNIFDTTLRRRVITGKAIVAEMLEDNIGYIKISHFSNNSAEEFINDLSSLIDENMDKLILDLRGNPGGEAHQVIPIASSLLDNSIKYLFSIKSRTEEKEKFKRDRDMIYSGPLVVLCNEHSASASEVLISILKDYDRCTTVGTTTYGKQVSQEIFRMNSENKVFLSTGLCVTPKEREYNKVGIKPDYEVTLIKNSKDTQMAKAIELLKEEN